MGMHMSATAWRRLAIEAEIEAHLERVTILLARIDGEDARSEDLEDDDPAGDHLDLTGEANSDDGRGLLPIRPIWSLDQTQGPLNFKEASREYAAAELGLVRSSTGGWQRS